MTVHRGSRACVAVAVTVGAMFGVAACAPGGDSGGGNESTAASEKVSKDVAAEGDVTLKMSHFWSTTEGDWINAVIKKFEGKYPNVKIETTVEDWDQLNKTLNLQLQDDDGPDIASANNGWQSLGTLAKGGLVLNLDNYAKLYGWDDTIPSTIARQNQFTTDFKKIGEGSWFATPLARASLIGIYYNAEKLQKLGVEPPTTYEEFIDIATKAKAAGEVPIAYGSQDGGSAALLGVQALLADKTKLNDYIYDDPSIKATDINMAEAAQTLKKWSEDGWFTPSFQGVDFTNSVAKFKDNKEGVFQFQYSGALGITGEQLNQFGYIQLKQKGKDSTVAVGAAPGAIVISSKCKHPNAAAAFLDYLLSKDASQISVDMGLVPMLNDVPLPADKLSLATETKATKTLDADDGYVPYFDWSSPSMLDTLNQNLQLMYAGKTTPDKLAEAVDADRDKFIKEQLG